jgi:hypothetical protein
MNHGSDSLFVYRTKPKTDDWGDAENGSKTRAFSAFSMSRYVPEFGNTHPHNVKNENERILDTPHFVTSHTIETAIAS